MTSWTSRAIAGICLVTTLSGCDLSVGQRSAAPPPVAASTPSAVPTPEVTRTVIHEKEVIRETVTATATATEREIIPDNSAGYPGYELNISRRQTYDSNVVWVQEALQRYGLYYVVVDGHFGPQTRGAVRSFQSARGLYVDGRVGRRTWAELAYYH